jgi:hypothetical protein
MARGLPDVTLGSSWGRLEAFSLRGPSNKAAPGLTTRPSESGTGERGGRTVGQGKSRTSRRRSPGQEGFGKAQ